MISIKFQSAGGRLEGFSLTGHGTSDEGDDFGRIVCAAVSSAVYMAANTLTEIVGAKADITVEDGYLRLTVRETNDKTEIVLQGLELHISTLAQDYDEYILCEEKTL